MNKDKYNELCERVGNASIDAWYEKTEAIFKEQEIRSENDFIKLVAFAYSWMPTIPEWRLDLNWKACQSALKDFKEGKSGALKKLLELIVPSINNSIVGASKVLYFACPEHASIIDSNVVIGWRALFFPGGVRKRGDMNVARLPSDFGTYGADTRKRERHIDLYVKYTENLAEWARILGTVSAREIELNLYLLGKQISDEVKKANEAI